MQAAGEGVDGSASQAWVLSTSVITVAGLVTSASQIRARPVGLASAHSDASPIDDQRRCKAVRLGRSLLLVMKYRTS
jgi:hypothetical protein